MRSAIRSRMTHRVSTSRDSGSMQRDAIGQPVTSKTTPLSDEPCYWQAGTERFIEGDGGIVAFATHLLLLRPGADVQPNDFTTKLVDRRGTALKANTLRVVNVVNRETHVEARAEEYS